VTPLPQSLIFWSLIGVFSTSRFLQNVKLGTYTAHAFSVNSTA